MPRERRGAGGDGARRSPPRHEAGELLRRLRLWVALSGRSQREIEDRGGFPRGYLSRLLAGRRELKYRHLVAVLAATGLEPADFFGEAFPCGERAATMAALGRLAGERTAPLPRRRDVLQLVAFGVEAVEELDRRLARCEAALAELRRLGVAAERP